MKIIMLMISVLQDVSYMCCIEIKGKEENILRGVGHLFNSQNGKTIFFIYTCTCIYKRKTLGSNNTVSFIQNLHVW